MRVLSLLGATAALFGAVSATHATVIGFAQLGGNNTTVPATLGSNATADANGVSVANGTTPNITLAWDALWDIHTSGQFLLLEQKTVGGTWDNDGNTANARIGQLDSVDHNIVLTAAPGTAVVVNSFDFGMTSETAGTSSWTLSLTDAGSNVVWSQNLNFTTVGQGQNVGDVKTITPAFTGTLGGSYTLRFFRTAASYNTDGRMGLDNFSFSQVVPEPATLGMLLAGVPTLLRRRRA